MAKNKTPTAPASGPTRDPRPLVYAALDLLMAALYAVLLFAVIPNRHGWVTVLFGLVTLSPVAMGVAMLARRSWAWWMGAVACGALLTLTIVLLAVTLMSAAFLAGVYGAFGRAASLFTLLGAALIVELFALLPAFQLKFLMTRAGRRSFGQEPIWP